MDYILPKFRFYEEVKEAQRDPRLKDRILVYDWGVSNSLTSPNNMEELGVHVMHQEDIRRLIDLKGEKICWITMGSVYMGARSFYKQNERTLRKVEYVLFVSKASVLPCRYYGIELCKVVKEDSCLELLACFRSPSHTFNNYKEPKKSLWKRI